MNLSVSSVFITLVITLLMIFLFYLILFNKKLIFLLRSDLLIVLSFIIIIRLLFPVEWSFTITLPFSWVMNPLQSFLDYKILNNFSILSLLLIVWIIGCVIQIFRFVVQLKKINNVFGVLDKTAIKKKVSDYLDVDHQFDYPVWFANGIPFPMILGFKKIILVPNIDLEKNEFKHVILHEIEHLRHHDNLIKLFLNILLIIYWWFPPVHWLCNKIQLVLEMRVDKKVTNGLSDLKVAEYADTLLKVQKALSSRKNMTFNQLGVSSTFYINDGSSTLYYRIMYLLNRNYKKSTNALLILIILLVPLISNCIVLEPYIAPSVDEYSSTSANDLENGFILKHSDGSYSLYINGSMETISEPDSDLLSQYPIITE